MSIHVDYSGQQVAEGDLVAASLPFTEKLQSFIIVNLTDHGFIGEPHEHPGRPLERSRARRHLVPAQIIKIKAGE